MSELKHEIVRLVDCHNLDKFVAEHLEPFGVTWNALDTGYDGYHNGTMRDVRVEHGAEIEDDEDQDFGRWITGEGPFYLPDNEQYALQTPDVQHILQWLCNRGKVPEGKYVVEMWW